MTGKARTWDDRCTGSTGTLLENGVRAWPAAVPLIVAVTIAFAAVRAGWPRWAFMWLLAGGIYGGCKWLTWHLRRTTGAPWWRHLGYLAAWPGMDADRFLNPVSQPVRPPPLEWAVAAGRLLAGAGLFFWTGRWVAGESPLLAGWLGMVGVVLMLHFGVFHLLSCAWRAAGVNAPPVMDRPLRSKSLHEFWGRRWNAAFRDLAHGTLFRPLAPYLGPQWAFFAAFLVSGLVHDLVISMPAGGGYGGPTLYFILQGVAVLVERSRLGRALVDGPATSARLSTALLLAGPLGLLFHGPFVHNIVLPFMQATGAL